MNAIKFVFFGYVLASCSSGSVYFGEDEKEDNATFLAEHESATNILLTSVVPGASSMTHEYYIEDSTDPKSFIAVPRDLDRSLWLVTSNAVTLDWTNTYEPQFSADCFQIIEYEFDELDNSASHQLLRLPEEPSGDCPNSATPGLQEFPIAAVLNRDLIANTATIDSSGLPLFKKTLTINSGWQALPTDQGPPLLQAPVSYPTEQGFLLWGKHKDEARIYASLYNHDERVWLPIFGLEHAPASDAILTHTWNQGTLFVVAKSGLFLFDTDKQKWIAPTADAAAIWPEQITMAWAALGADVFMVIARTGNAPELVDNIYLLESPGRWRQVLSRPAPHMYGRPLWDGTAFILWSPNTTVTEFLYPQAADTLVTLNTPNYDDFHFFDLRKHGPNIVRIQFLGNSATRAERLSKNRRTWTNLSIPFSARQGSIPVTSLTGDWHLDYGNVDFDRQAHNGTHFYNSDWSHVIHMQPTAEIEKPTIGPAVAWSHDRLFVWGGCEQLDDVRCVAFSPTGYVLNTSIRP